MGIITLHVEEYKLSRNKRSIQRLNKSKTTNRGNIMSGLISMLLMLALSFIVNFCMMIVAAYLILYAFSVEINTLQLISLALGIVFIKSLFTISYNK